MRPPLADKTRRGLSGRISDGKSAGGISYGYKVPRDILDQPIKGELYIDPTEAAIIKRIFREYAEGRSPLKIAAGLNEDGIPAPSGAGKDAAHWRQNTINGNKERGTGILNNELYIGRRIWNRLNYRKDPTTGRRVSRLNPQSEWSISEVLELRIVDEKLWELVKERQASHAEIRKTADNQDRNGLSSSQRLRRKKFLLSGLPRCGKCGAPLTVAAARYYCSTTKEKGKSICSGIPGLNRPRIEAHVLNQFRNHLMTDSAYKQFKTAYTKQLKQQQQANADLEHIHNRTIAKLKKEAEHLLSAVRSRPSNELLLDELDKVSKQLKLAETQRDQVRQEAVPLPEDMPALYRGYVDNIVQMLSDESIVGRAADMLHDMINQIIVNYEEDSQSFRITLDGKIAQMLAGSNAEAAEAYLSSESSLKLVAGERSQIFYGLYRGASSNASTIQPYPAQTATS